ncbi:MAG: DUF1178 family protein [Magnetovibrionaceae bacterium]
MIRYALICSKEHVFEEWFSSSADYDDQAKAGQIVCPDCGDTKISKTIMAPNIGKQSRPEPCRAAAPACASRGCPMAG